MKMFTDSHGEEWDVEITGAAVKRAERHLGIDLGRPQAGDQPWLTRFETDLAFKVDLIYVVCLSQIRDRGLNGEQFAERLAQEVLCDASIAFYAALTDFFLGLGMQDEATAIQAQIALLPELYGAAARQAQRMIAAALGRACASLRPSPASTRSGTVCGNSC